MKRTKLCAKQRGSRSVLGPIQAIYRTNSLWKQRKAVKVGPDTDGPIPNQNTYNLSQREMGFGEDDKELPLCKFYKFMA